VFLDQAYQGSSASNIALTGLATAVEIGQYILVQLGARRGDDAGAGSAAVAPSSVTLGDGVTGAAAQIIPVSSNRIVGAESVITAFALVEIAAVTSAAAWSVSASWPSSQYQTSINAWLLPAVSKVGDGENAAALVIQAIEDSGITFDAEDFLFIASIVAQTHDITLPAGFTEAAQLGSGFQYRTKAGWRQGGVGTQYTPTADGATARQSQAIVVRAA